MSLFSRYGASPTPAFTLRFSDDSTAEAGDVVIAQRKPASKRTIHDLAIYVDGSLEPLRSGPCGRLPGKCSSALRQSIICGASSRFPPRLWLRYDQRFRVSAAADATLRWDHRNNEKH